MKIIKMAIVKILKNTYPNSDIYQAGTICIWIKDSRGWLYLYPTDGTKKHADYEKKCVMSFGQVYAQNGNLLSGKKEPLKIGLIAKYIKEGWFLDVENYS